MRSLLLFFMIAFTAIPTNSQTIEGSYSNKWEASSGESIQYSLTLLEDGNFIFNSTQTYRDNLPDRLVEAKGTWNLNGQLLILNTNGHVDADNKLQTNLNMNKARFINVSTRNPDFNLVNPSLKFYKSDVFYAKDMVLIKSENKVSSIN